MILADSYMQIRLPFRRLNFNLPRGDGDFQMEYLFGIYFNLVLVIKIQKTLDISIFNYSTTALRKLTIHVLYAKNTLKLQVSR